MYNNKLTIKNWAEEDRPREKLLLKGKSNLTDAELLAIIIGSGNNDCSAVELAQKILIAVNNDLGKLIAKTIEDLMQFKGIGEAKAISIIASLELGNRLLKIEHKNQIQIKSSKNIFDYMQFYFSNLQHEEFWVLLLNQNNKIITKQKISSGGLNSTIVDVRMILNLVLKNLAVGIVLCHNHPSGNLQPSQQDKQLTQKIKNACNLIDVTLLDHLIFANQQYYSFADNGMI